jgi:RNase adaptor protein for sRNA GlmZ degradation
MSGTGKSSALEVLASWGRRTVDTDTDEWSRWVSLEDGSKDWIWREDAIATLLAESVEPLYVAGCKTNQGSFYESFDAVVLLRATWDVMVARLEARTTNPYGTHPDELALIREHLEVIEPRLAATATAVIDTSSMPVLEVARRIEAYGTTT